MSYTAVGREKILHYPFSILNLGLSTDLVEAAENQTFNCALCIMNYAFEEALIQF